MVEAFSSRADGKEESKGDGNKLSSMPIDLVAMAWRRKYVVIASVAVAVVLGTALAWVSPPLYRYVCAIQIGEVVLDQGSGGRKIIPLEKQNDVVVKLRSIYIPLTTAEYLVAHPAENYRYAVRTYAAARGNVVWLRAVGPKRYGAGYISIMQSVVNRIIRDDKFIVEPFRARYRADEEKAQIRLRDLSNAKIFEVHVMKLKNAVLLAQSSLGRLEIAGHIMRGRVERYNKKVRLVNREIKSLNALSAGQRKTRGEALKGINSPERAMTLMVIDNNSRLSAERLFHLRKQRDVALPGVKQALLGKIAENKRAQADEEQEISALRAKLVSLYVSHRNQVATQEQEVALSSAQVAQQRNTVVLQAPVRLAQSVGPHRLGRVVLAAIGGLTFGIMLAFILELTARRGHGQCGSVNPAD